MSVDITTDTREFDKALLEYTAASKKSFAEAANRCAKNLAIHALKETKKADVGAIRNLKNSKAFTWWLAWQIKRKRDGTAQAHNDKHFLKTGFFMRGMFRKEAIKTAIKSIGKRVQQVGFLKAYFSEMAKAVDGKGSGKTFNGFRPTASLATDANPTCEVSVRYDYKKRNKAASDGAETLLNAALTAAIPTTTKDMLDYVEKKLDELGRAYSSK